MDDVGLGSYLENFGLLCGAILFIAVLLLAKLVIKMTWMGSFILALVAGAIGYFASPYIFFWLFTVLGYSF